MKLKFFLLLISLSLHATPFDYFYLYKADSFTKDGKTNDALYCYNQIKNKTDDINYNIGNLLYKERSYEKAINAYKKITDTKLKYQTLHNLGNSYAKAGKVDNAIKSYEEALRIKKDKDTLFNLKLLRNKKEDENQDNKKVDEQNKNKEKSNQQEDMKNINQQLKEDKIQKEKVQRQVKKTGELSDLEEKKWSQILENREVRTFMVPISNNGEKNEQNIKPW
ncbi:MAG: tetratricopeptide repeat protein [Epsilonproteobacteria bacterium]|nr:tetratricopeptide repeat protein [Campylobacterota bacterium]